MLDFISHMYRDVFAPGQLGFYVILMGVTGIVARITASGLKRFNRYNQAERVRRASLPICYMILGACIVDFIREVAPIVAKVCSKL